jgi:hypothetical protein
VNERVLGLMGGSVAALGWTGGKNDNKLRLGIHIAVFVLTWALLGFFMRDQQSMRLPFTWGRKQIQFLKRYVF